MKLPVILFITLLTLYCTVPATAQTGNNKLVITHLTGDFYVYTTYHDYKGTPYPSNSMYMVTSNGVVLIDTPWDSAQFQPLLDSIEVRHHKRAVFCISTHFHADRTAGLEYYRQKGIKTWSSEQTRRLCAEKNEKQAEFTFSKDTTFTIGNHTFQAYYPGEAHSKDNIVIWFKKEKILYGGCAVKSTEASDLGNLSDANVAQWPESIKNMMKQFGKPAFVIPGHLSWASNESLAHTLKLLQDESKK